METIIPQPTLPVQRRESDNAHRANGTYAAGDELPLVRRLCEELDAADVSYCHWKSNNALDRSANGENDVDLLIARSDAERFATILHRLGFKELFVAPSKHVPGILNYYGHDLHASRLIHVHAHYQLVLGHDATKNYHLPVETAYLESSTKQGLFPVPSPEFELVVFILRMIFKHCAWDTILLFRQGKLKSGERAELDYLQERIDPLKFEAVIQEHFPQLTPTLVQFCLEALRPQAPVVLRLSAGRDVARALNAQGRRPVLGDVIRKLTGRSWQRLHARLDRYHYKKRLARGGAMVAIVGGDGSGKSTSIEALHGWLKKDVATMRVHLGRPRWSKRTWLARTSVKFCRLLGWPWRKLAGRKADSSDEGQLGLGRMIQLVCVAHDRRLEYIRARRFATNGGVAICDRFPLPEIKVMDGPVIRRQTSSANASKLSQILMHWEERYYQGIHPPEVLMALKVDPEVAVIRREGEDPGPVRRRNKALCAVDFSPYGGVDIDAGQTREQVLAQLKSVVWSKL